MKFKLSILMLLACACFYVQPCWGRVCNKSCKTNTQPSNKAGGIPVGKPAGYRPHHQYMGYRYGRPHRKQPLGKHDAHLLPHRWWRYWGYGLGGDFAPRPYPYANYHACDFTFPYLELRNYGFDQPPYGTDTYDIAPPPSWLDEPFPEVPMDVNAKQLARALILSRTRLDDAERKLHLLKHSRLSGSDKARYGSRLTEEKEKSAKRLKKLFTLARSQAILLSSTIYHVRRGEERRYARLRDKEQALQKAFITFERAEKRNTATQCQKLEVSRRRKARDAEAASVRAAVLIRRGLETR